MIRSKYFIILGAGLLWIATACNDGYEREPVEQFTLDYVFSKTDSAGVQARRFLNDIYLNHLDNGHNRVGNDYLDAASDDAISIDKDDPDVYLLSVGRYSANTRVESDMKWGTYYQGIRKANILVNNIDVVPFNISYKTAKGEVKPLNVSMKAEARFLRAYMYFELVKRYGGVPLVGDEVYVLGDDMELPRNTFEQCIDYIVGELDEIKDDLRGLPMDDSGDFAHVPTKEACMAMKARVLLYAASPLFNERPIEPGNELIGYASYDSQRWKLAADAAKEFIEEFGPKGSGNIDLTANFCNIFLNFYGTENKELIFFYSIGKSKTIETNNGPLGFSGSAQGNGRTTPTQNLVDAFPMKDGKMPGKSDKYDYNMNMLYTNRDPRLEFTVLHNGSKWLNKILDITQGGTNNPSGAQANETGYYLRKFMCDCTGDVKDYPENMHLWPILRYAEVLLNYAEAENESLSAPSDDIYDALIALRKRAGIEAGDDNLYGLKKPMSKDEMREVIQNERRIEMAFEEQRYWDIRRWRLAEEIFKKPLKGLTILNNNGQLNYVETNVLSATFDVKRYFYPIPYSEVIKNNNMIQNPNW